VYPEKHQKKETFMSLATRSEISNPRLESLLSRHAALETELHEEQRHVSSTDYVRQLKRRKLQLKEEIEGIRRAS
jgi:hypothetical protein